MTQFDSVILSESEPNTPHLHLFYKVIRKHGDVLAATRQGAGMELKNHEPFNLFRLGPHPMAEGLVIKKPRLAILIKVAANLMLGLTIALYAMFSKYLLESNDLPEALGIIAFMTLFYLVIWRGIPFYKVVFLEDYAMGPPDVDTCCEIPEKMSTLV